MELLAGSRQRILAEPNLYLAGRAGVQEAINILSDAVEAGQLELADRERQRLQMMRDKLAALPDDEHVFIGEIVPTIDAARFVPSEYGLPAMS